MASKSSMKPYKLNYHLKVDVSTTTTQQNLSKYNVSSLTSCGSDRSGLLDHFVAVPFGRCALIRFCSALLDIDASPQPRLDLPSAGKLGLMKLDVAQLYPLIDYLRVIASDSITPVVRFGFQSWKLILKPRAMQIVYKLTQVRKYCRNQCNLCRTSCHSCNHYRGQ